MKKIILLILISILTNQANAASTYLIALDKNITEEIQVITNEDNIPKGESPYTVKELVSVNYKNNSDGLATLDTSTGLEWLDLTETDNMSISQVESLLGSTFSGWRLPTSDEVTQLMAKYQHQDFYNAMLSGSTVNITNNIPQYTAAKSFADFFGMTGSGGGFNYSYGFLRHNGGIVLSGSAPYITPAGHGQVYSRYNNGDYNESITNSLTGVWLVSEGGTTLSSQENPNINTPVE
jgi:hypothetical protein